MTTRLLLVTFCLGFLMVSKSAVAEPSPALGQSYALLIGGLPGQEPYGRWFDDWLARFQKYLTQTAKVPPANVTLLSRDAATTDTVLAAIGKFAQRARPQDQFILFIVGHGEVVNGQTPTLALRGPDLTAQQLAAALNAVPAKNQVILNFSASSGDFLKYLVSPDRVNITGTSPTEIKAPVFPEFFLRGLESNWADADKNGTVTLLETYNWAAQQTAMWIARWKKTGPTTGEAANLDKPTLSVWQASGKETVGIFQKLYAGAPTRQLDPASDAKAVDTVVEVIPPNGEITDDWKQRRIIDEHAMLEDCGQEIGVSEIGDKGLQPILGVKPNDPGYLSSHTVIGKPALRQ